MFLIVATPIGWVGLIVSGLAAAVSIGMNGYIKNNRGSFYDNLMKDLGLK
ncbi:hypothetical protein L4D77_17360 [Photobacterium frigidiphilum]